MQPLQTVKSETLADLLIRLVRNFEKRLIRPLSKSFIKKKSVPQSMDYTKQNIYCFLRSKPTITE